MIETGDLPEELSSHAPMHMYRWSELRDLLQLIPAASSPPPLRIRLSHGRVHRELHLSLTDEERELLTTLEIELAAEPGAIGIGEHIIAVVEK